MSLATVAVTPRMTLVWLVTVTVSRWVCPSLVPLYTSVRPTGSGKYGLSITATKLLGSKTGALAVLGAEAALAATAMAATAIAAQAAPVSNFRNIDVLLCVSSERDQPARWTVRGR